MGRLAPVARRDLIRRLLRFGFDGPFSGGRHEFMLRADRRLILSNPHRGDISVDTLQQRTHLFDGLASALPAGGGDQAHGSVDRGAGRWGPRGLGRSGRRLVPDVEWAMRGRWMKTDVEGCRWEVNHGRGSQPHS